MPERDKTLVNATLAPVLMVVANVAAIAIGYAITVVLARHLSHAEFAQYVGTMATVGLLSSLAEAGFGKYALKILPVYQVQHAMALLRGYVYFALVGCVGVSVLLGALALAFEIRMQSGQAQSVFVVAIFFLPAMAVFGVAVDMLLSLRMVASATLFVRVLVPLTTLGFIGWGLQTNRLDASGAVICFGMGSLGGAGLAMLLCIFMIRSQTRGVGLQLAVNDWTWNSLSFLAVGFLIAWLFKAPLVLVHHLPHQALQLALLAPAFETGCLVILLSKSTDKFFQPMMSLIIESKDWTQAARLRKRVWRWLEPALSCFCCVSFGLANGFWGCTARTL